MLKKNLYAQKNCLNLQQSASEQKIDLQHLETKLQLNFLQLALNEVESEQQINLNQLKSQEELEIRWLKLNQQIEMQEIEMKNKINLAIQLGNKKGNKKISSELRALFKYFQKSGLILSIGTMSGTSMDAVDVVIVISNGEFIIIEVAHLSIAYSLEFHHLLKVAEYLVCKCQGDMSQAYHMDFASVFIEYFTEVIKLSKEKILEYWKNACLYLNKDLNAHVNFLQIIDHSTFLHEVAIRKVIHNAGLTPSDFDCVGYHGQTLYHNPKNKITIQVGDPQKLADRLNIMIINDFRSRDVALGGQGAPLAPLYHLALAVRDQMLPLAVVNCGGIANISLIPTADYKNLKGYDTGPGNGLIDLFVKQRTNFKESMDYNGKYGLNGVVHPDIIEKLYAKSVLIAGENYFDIMPPKSLDINNLKLIKELDELSIEDGCATLAAFTADSIIKNLDKFASLQPRHWVLAGGGWYNPVIMRELKQRIQTQLGEGHKIFLAQEVGWNNKAIEAQIFAYLAIRVLKHLPISVPETTGVPRPITFAKISISHNNFFCNTNSSSTSSSIIADQIFDFVLDYQRNAFTSIKLSRSIENNLEPDSKADCDADCDANDVDSEMDYAYYAHAPSLDEGDIHYSGEAKADCDTDGSDSNNDIFNVNFLRCSDGLVSDDSSIGNITEDEVEKRLVLNEQDCELNELSIDLINIVSNNAKVNEYFFCDYYTAIAENNYALQQIFKLGYQQDSIKIIDNLISLAQIYQKLGNYQEALKYYQFVLNIGEHRSIIYESPLFLNILNKAGKIYSILGMPMLAINCYFRAMRMCKTIYAKNSVYLSDIFTNIGDICQTKENYQFKKYQLMALKYYNMGLNILHNNYKEHNCYIPEFANILSKIAIIYQNIGDLKLAINVYEQVSEIYSQIYNESHVDVAKTYDKMMNIYAILNDHEKVVLYYEKAIAIYKEYHDFRDIYPLSTYIYILNNFNIIAEHYKNIGDFTNALLNYRKALLLLENISYLQYDYDHQQLIMKNILRSLDDVHNKIANYNLGINYNNHLLCLYKNSIHDKSQLRYVNTDLVESNPRNYQLPDKLIYIN